MAKAGTNSRPDMAPRWTPRRRSARPARKASVDRLGHTLWYKVTGTGRRPVTFDTAGSTFDTVIGLFARDGDDFNELACVDDVLSDPVGSTYQAALTFDTVAGHTYWVEVGGIQNFFDASQAESGVLKIKVS